MADTTFVNYQSPPIYAEWLNDVNGLVYKGRNPYFAVATVPSANTYVLTFPAGSQYMPIYGDVISFAVPTANTGASTLTIITSVQTVGPYAITQGGSALVANALMPGTVYQATFNGSGFSIPIVGAPLANPAFTGTPTAPTATAGTNTTQIATTAFVTSAIGGVATGHGQCRLTKSGANILLSPYGGRSLVINGTTQMIPSAGVTLAPTGLTASTLYYVYAYMNAGTMTLEASTTGHSTDTTGIEIKTGDSTRTLVGMVRPVTGPSFQDTNNQRFVLSYFNRKTVAVYTSAFTSGTISSTTLIEISSANRAEYLTWGDEAILMTNMGSVNNSGQFYIISALYFDNTQLTQETPCIVAAAGAASFPLCITTTITLGEGYHYTQLYGRVSGGSGQWYNCQVLSQVRG